jgi:hypothetical protein
MGDEKAAKGKTGTTPKQNLKGAGEKPMASKAFKTSDEDTMSADGDAMPITPTPAPKMKKRAYDDNNADSDPDTPAETPAKVTKVEQEDE